MTVTRAACELYPVAMDMGSDQAGARRSLQPDESVSAQLTDPVRGKRSVRAAGDLVLGYAVGW